METRTCTDCQTTFPGEKWQKQCKRCYARAKNAATQPTPVQIPVEDVIAKNAMIADQALDRTLGILEKHRERLRGFGVSADFASTVFGSIYIASTRKNG